MKRLAPREADTAVLGGGEIAFLDLREAGPFSMGHPLFAVPCPYSTLETAVAALVPRRDVPVVLIDDGDGIAERAAGRLAALGYTDVAIVDGGAPRWASDGLTLYKGVNIPSKTLGELAEALWHPQTITAETLARWRREGIPLQLFDVRPPTEHAKMRVPGSRCLPNGELAHRFDAVVGDAPVVVTCAGRTRGLVGALGLARVGLGGAVHALENGTQGWVLAGEALERGNAPDPFPELAGEARAATAARAEAFLTREAIPTLDAAAVAPLAADPTRTTFLFDVRSAEEARADPLAAFVHAPSGQLVQATDQWVGVRGARLVLADDLGLRAGLAAFWLRALGYDVAVALIDDTLRSLPPQKPPRPPADVPTISAAEALARAGRGEASLLDVRSSAAYGKAHIRGAAWSNRSLIAREPPAKPVLIIGDGSPSAALCAVDLVAMGIDAAVVEGGHAVLVEAGAATEENAGRPAGAVDYTWFADGRHDGDLAASREYLAWEQGLLAQLTPAERAAFRLGEGDGRPA